MSRADYAHWNEDADYMWWNEEGKHAQEDAENAQWERDNDSELRDDDHDEPSHVDNDDEATVYVCLEEGNFNYVADIAAPGTGQSWECSTCGHPFIKLGNEWYDARTNLFEIDPEDVR